MKTQRTKWTYDIVREIAKQYQHIIDFKKNDYNAWQWASKKRNGREEFYKEITSHMIPKGTWYKKLVYRYDFPNNVVYFGITNDREVRMNQHKKRGSVYEYALIHNIQPIYTELTDYIDKKISMQMEKDLISEYRSLGWTVLNKTNGGENGGQDEYITKEMCQNEALKYKYRWEFGENAKPYYYKSLRKKWLDEVCSHMDDKYETWDEEKILKVANNCNLKNITEFSKMYSAAYQLSAKLKIRNKLNEIFEWGGGKKWTKKEIADIAQKYSIRRRFIREHKAAAYYAMRKNWYDEITSHMTFQPGGKRWTKEEVHQEALKYKTRTEFARATDTKGCNKFYQSAIHNKWIDEVCSHMIKKNSK